MKKLLCFIGLMFSASLSFGANEANFPELGAEEVAQINQYAEKLVLSMQKNAIPEFGYDEQSVQFLSEVITKEGSSYSEQAREVLPSVYGSYLGVAIIKKYGGKWVNAEGIGYGVMIDANNIAFPFNKVSKHIKNGEEDSIYTLYLNANNTQKLIKKSN